MNETIFSRKNNKVNVGGIKATIPTGVLALNLLAQNPIANGDAFKEDGYIYRKGKPVMKWFSPFGRWKHFWEPVLEQVARLENIYHYLDARSKTRWDRLFAVVKEIYDTGKTGNTIGTSRELRRIAHCFDGNGWRAIEVDNDTANYGMSFSVNYLDKKPEKIVNRKLGEQVFRLNEQLMQASVTHEVAELLDRAIIKKIRHEFPNLTRKDEGRIFDISINNRRYIYAVMPERYGVSVKKVIWPEEKYSAIDLTIDE